MKRKYVCPFSSFFLSPSIRKTITIITEQKPNFIHFPFPLFLLYIVRLRYLLLLADSEEDMRNATIDEVILFKYFYFVLFF